MTGRRIVHVVVPDGFDDPHRVSGGSIYDRRLARTLPAHGWQVGVVRAGADPAAALAALPEGSAVLLDGLVARRIPAAVEAEAERLRVVVLAHMVSAAFPAAHPDDVEGERRALCAARHVIATSDWTRDEVTAHAGVPGERITVAVPGTDDAPAAEGTPSGTALLCLGVVAPHKGQDVLVDTLALLDRTPSWTCMIAGSLTTHPAFAQRVRDIAAGAGVADRVRMPGVLTGAELADAYRRTDLLVAPSRVEASGMAIAEALRRGIPVVATSAGGIPQTVAGGAATLVPPGQPAALRDVLDRWMTDPSLRRRVKAEALGARTRLPRWADTAAVVADALERLR